MDVNLIDILFIIKERLKISMNKNKIDKVFLVTSGKGGVGKSTISVSMASKLSELNYNVLVIDMDMGLRNLDIMMGLEDKVKYDVIDFINGKCKLKDAILKDPDGNNLSLLPATEDITKVLDANKFNLLIDHLRKLFDYIVIDSPAGIEEGFLNSTINIDKALVVVNQDRSSITDANRVIDILDLLEIKDVGIVINRYTNLKEEYFNIEDVYRLLGCNSIQGLIRESDIVVKYTNKGIIPSKIRGTEFAEDIELLVDNILTGNNIELDYSFPEYNKRENTSGLIGSIVGKILNKKRGN